jgi:orotidine-5'-phosphate decarboxylase
MVHEVTGRDQGDSFSVRIQMRASALHTWLCVGIDPDVERLPVHLDRSAAGVARFCTEIIEATHDLAAAYKINFAFFEALGGDGWQALQVVRTAIPVGVPVIADAKRGDIPNTAAAYAHAIFGVLEFDAVTLSPYLGWDSILPFADRTGKCVFVLCKTSNPGASTFQDLLVDGEPLYLRVARDGLALETVSDLGFVVGATQPDALRAVRALSQDALLLVPGVGAQGAQAVTALQVGGNKTGDNAIVPVSREILYASSGTDFAAAARAATEKRARDLWMQQEPTHAGR